MAGKVKETDQVPWLDSLLPGAYPGVISQGEAQGQDQEVEEVVVP